MYDFTLVHVPGKKHKAPDALSRRRYTLADGPPESDLEDSLDESISSPQDFPKIEGKEPVRVGAIHRRDKDQEIRDIMRFLVSFKPPATTSSRERQRFLGLAARHYIKEGQLYRRHPSGQDQKVITSGKDREQILTELHDGIGHRGEWAVWEAIHI